MFRRKKPRILFAFSACIAVCLDHVKLAVIETPRYLLVSDVSMDSIRCFTGQFGFFFGITLMAMHFLGLNSICQSFSHFSSDDRSNWRA